MSSQPLSPSIFTYRQNGSAYNDPQWGQGSRNFLSGTAAVAQAIYTRLLLLQGEWWESILAGTPLFQQMIGQSGPGGNTTLQQQIANSLQQIILSVPYVIALSNVQFSFNTGSRTFSFNASVQTSFGTIPINFPTPPAQGVPS
jgi:hypothetical protein